MNDKEYLNRLLQQAYASSSFLDFANTNTKFRPI